jgi:hypothetical protein
MTDSTGKRCNPIFKGDFSTEVICKRRGLNMVKNDGDMGNEIKISSFVEDGKIFIDREFDSGYSDIRKEIIRQVFDATDEIVKQRLVEMGRMPPGGAEHCCGTCKHYENSAYSNLSDICKLSEDSFNGMMVATDDCPDSPMLCVSDRFGCNQWAAK